MLAPILDLARHVKAKFSATTTAEQTERETVLQDYSAHQQKLDIEESILQLDPELINADETYRYLHHYFHHRAPSFLREHREYFGQNRRGFGEDAFHAMWWLLFLKFRPTKCLEIGVYRGQVLSLWCLLGKTLSIPVDATGISPLSPDGDVVSGGYLNDINYEEDIQTNFRHFGLEPAQLVRAFSSDDRALDVIKSTQWDLIYIDGNHDYHQVVADYEACHQALKTGGLLVFDDAAAELDYTAPKFAFAGHPGPSRLVKERVCREMMLLASCGHNVVFQKLP